MHKICSFVYFATIPILTENGATAGTTTAADQDDSRSILPATVTTAPPYLDGAIFRQTKTATISENPSGRSGAPCQRYLQESHELHCQRILPADRNHHRITALPYQQVLFWLMFFLPVSRVDHLIHPSHLSGTTAEPSTEPPQPHRSTALSNTHTSPTESHREPYNSTGGNSTIHTAQGTDRAIEQATLTAAISRPGAAHKAHRATTDRRSIHRTPTAHHGA